MVSSTIFWISFSWRFCSSSEISLFLWAVLMESFSSRRTFLMAILEFSAFCLTRSTIEVRRSVDIGGRGSKMVEPSRTGLVPILEDWMAL